jgi:hypothetical protein
MLSQLVTDIILPVRYASTVTIQSGSHTMVRATNAADKTSGQKEQK